MHTVSLGVGALVTVGVAVIVFAYKLGYAMGKNDEQHRAQRLARAARRQNDSEHAWLWKP